MYAITTVIFAHYKLPYDFVSKKFLIAVFLQAFPYIPTPHPPPFINFGDFCQPPRLLFWPKFASLPVYSALPF